MGLMLKSKNHDDKEMSHRAFSQAIHEHRVQDNISSEDEVFLLKILDLPEPITIQANDVDKLKPTRRA